MKKNMGNTDRVIRILIAAVIAVLFFMNIITGTLGYILLGLGGGFVFTNLIRNCRLYSIFGGNSRSEKK